MGKDEPANDILSIPCARHGKVRDRAALSVLSPSCVLLSSFLYGVVGGKKSPKSWRENCRKLERL